jgi:hypothetical protein
MRIYMLFASLLVLGCRPSPANGQEEGVAKNKDATAIKVVLKDLVEKKGKLEKLSVTYSDLHGLHGGLNLQINGDGAVSQKAVREKVRPPKKVVDRADVIALIKLLVKHEAWDQRVPERTAVPDESSAQITIMYGKKSTVIWEWYNDMKANKRLIEIRELMKKIAWKEEKAEQDGS